MPDIVYPLSALSGRPAECEGPGSHTNCTWCRRDISLMPLHSPSGKKEDWTKRPSRWEVALGVLPMRPPTPLRSITQSLLKMLKEELILAEMEVFRGVPGLNDSIPNMCP